jgi:hypothetical protein
MILIAMLRRHSEEANLSYKRDLENNNGNPIEIVVIMTADGIDSSRVDLKSKIHISYQSVKKLMISKNHYILLTEAKQSITFQKDGFVKGTSDEFLSFLNQKINSNFQKRKMSKTKAVLIALASLISIFIAVSLYMVNGRTIFENRKKPSEAEEIAIHDIIAYEQDMLSECLELLKPYDARLKELGIEIRIHIKRDRAVNSQGLVEEHDWNKDMWIPKHYSSSVYCQIYKDGRMLEQRTSSNTISYFVNFFWLVYAGKNEDTRFNENPFDRIDMSFSGLLDQVSFYLQDR